MANIDWRKVGSDSAKAGNKIQLDAIPLLEQHFVMVERIESAFKVFRIKGRMVAVPAAKVSGDFRAIIPNTAGRSVLIECKWRKGDRLLWSAMEDHQIEALNKHRELGGMSLILWVSVLGFYLFEPSAHPEFRPGNSLKSTDIFNMPFSLTNGGRMPVGFLKKFVNRLVQTSY
jgi:hypothetical protein